MDCGMRRIVGNTDQKVIRILQDAAQSDAPCGLTFDAFFVLKKVARVVRMSNLEVYAAMRG